MNPDRSRTELAVRIRPHLAGQSHVRVTGCKRPGVSPLATQHRSAQRPHRARGASAKLPAAFLITLITLIAALLPPSSAAATSIGGCRKPIAWRIGVVDRGFDVDAAKLQRMASSAAQRWNEAGGRTLFVDNPRARFTINLRYGQRQEVAQAIQDVGVQTAQREGLLDDMTRMLDKLVRKHNDDSVLLAAQVREFNRAAAQYKARSQQRITNKERRQLRTRRDALQDAQAALAREKQRLDGTRAEIEKLHHAIAARIERHNKTVTQANRTMNTLPREARQIGVTHINGRRSRIDLFQYYDDETLYVTLLHELGHALGLRHSSDERAVMHDSRNKTTAKDLTSSDVQALRLICRG